MYLSSQLFFETPHKTLKLPEKLKKNAFSAICRPKFQKNFPLVSTMGPPHGTSGLSKQ